MSDIPRCLPPLELRTLRYFTMVAEKLNFSVAAERLSVSQSAVSRQILLLEQELGIPLFDRVGRRVFLTPAGRELLEHAYAVRKGVESLAARAAELASGGHGELCIGATPQTMESLISPLLPGFRAKHPSLRISLVEEGSANLLACLERGSVDIAIGSPHTSHTFESRRLFPLVVLAALPPGHRLSRHRSIEISELANEEVLLLHSNFMTRMMFEGACQIAQIAPRVVVESASPQGLLALAQGGLGTAILPSTVRLAREQGAVVPLVQGGRPIGRWLHAMWDPRRYTPPALLSFVNELVTVAEGDYPGKSFRRRASMQGADFTAPLIKPKVR